MGIIHIILGILKVVGILLLILLGILLAALLAVLLCPVTYSASGNRDAEAYEGHVKIGWLFRLISFTFSFGSEKEGDFDIRIFGIPLNRKKKEQKLQKSQEISEKTEKKLSKTAEELSQKSVQEPRAVEPKQPDAKKIEQKKPEQEHVETEKAEESAEGSVFHKLQEFLEQLPGIPEKILKVFKKISLTVHTICDKINQIKEFLESERFARLKALFIQEGKRTFGHIRPRKVKGYIKFGTEDPSFTGRILAAAGIFFPLYGEHITIEPYFDQKILEGNISVKGRIYGVFFVRLAWKLLWNADIRYMIKKIKQG